MFERSKSILLSRTVWSAAIGVVFSVLQACGVTISTADIPMDQIIDIGIFLLTMFFRYTAKTELHVTAPPPPPAAL
jgi:hypothetical protein